MPSFPSTAKKERERETAANEGARKTSQNLFFFSFTHNNSLSFSLSLTTQPPFKSSPWSPRKRPPRPRLSRLVSFFLSGRRFVRREKVTSSPLFLSLFFLSPRRKKKLTKPQKTLPSPRRRHGMAPQPLRPREHRQGLQEIQGCSVDRQIG